MKVNISITVPQSFDKAESIRIENNLSSVLFAETWSCSQVSADLPHAVPCRRDALHLWSCDGAWNLCKGITKQRVAGVCGCLWEKERERKSQRSFILADSIQRLAPWNVTPVWLQVCLFHRENGHIDGWMLCNESVYLGRESMLYYFWLIKQSELAISPARTSHGWLHIIHRD